MYFIGRISEVKLHNFINLFYQLVANDNKIDVNDVDLYKV